MALILKKVTDILTEVRDTLQDQQQSRWTEQELFRYLDQGVRNIAVATRYNKVTDKLKVNDSLSAYPTNSLTLTQEAIEFYKITANQPHEIIDARTILFPDNTEEEVEIEYYAYPPRVVYGAATELLLDEDLYDAVRYFILYRAYQKEASAENISKAQYFKGEYGNILTMNATRWHGKFEVESTRTAFFR